MEAAFDSDFSDVRLRVPGDTARFEALAMARGDEIHLQTGAFDPHSASGLALLGHELAHIVQQRQGRVRGAGNINADPGLEAEADRAGQAASRGANANLGGAGQGRAVSSAVDAPVQRVWAKIVDGKVKYDVVAPKTDFNKPLQGYTWMTESEFVSFKNSGKRHESNKVTDRTTGTNFYTKDDTDYFTDKTMKTKAVTPPNKSDLIDRRRADRSGQAISLYDVTSYKDAKKHETKDDKMEHDHLPSGQSRKKNDPSHAQDAYNEALAIEIRGNKHGDGSDHKLFSPTYGGRQQKTDSVILPPSTGTGSVGAIKKVKGGTTNTPATTTHSASRPELDAKYPGAAYFRDTDTMLQKTEDTSLSRDKTDQIKQLGGYRYLYKQNVKEGVIEPKDEGFAPQSGYDALTAKGVTYETKKDPFSNTERSQGSLIDEMLNTHLAKRAK
jgi:hypothetical protein